MTVFKDSALPKNSRFIYGAFVFIGSCIAVLAKPVSPLVGRLMIACSSLAMLALILCLAMRKPRTPFIQLLIITLGLSIGFFLASTALFANSIPGVLGWTAGLLLAAALGCVPIGQLWCDRLTSHARCDVLIDRFRARLRAFHSVVFVLISGMMLIIYSGYQEGFGETWSLFEGISIWPTLIIRLIAAILAVYFLFCAAINMRRSEIELSDEFELNRSSSSSSNSSGKRLTTIWDWLCNLWGGISGEISKQSTGCAYAIWKSHLDRRYLEGRSRSMYLITGMAYCLVSFGFVLNMGKPLTPVRGEWGIVADKVFLGIGLIMMLTLTIYVIYNTLMCVRLIWELKSVHTTWPESLLERHFEIIDDPNRCDDNPECLARWLDIQFIARYTIPVSRLVIYPFVVLLLMILSRHHVFDAWDWTMPLIGVIGITFVIVLTCALELRRSAEIMRGEAIAHMESQYLQKIVPKRTLPDSANIKRIPEFDDSIRTMIESIKSIQTGAFAPLSRHPILTALLFPIGGVSAITLINHLMMKS